MAMRRMAPTIEMGTAKAAVGTGVREERTSGELGGGGGAGDAIGAETGEGVLVAAKGAWA